MYVRTVHIAIFYSTLLFYCCVVFYDGPQTLITLCKLVPFYPCSRWFMCLFLHSLCVYIAFQTGATALTLPCNHILGPLHHKNILQWQIKLSLLFEALEDLETECWFWMIYKSAELWPSLSLYLSLSLFLFLHLP